MHFVCIRMVLVAAALLMPRLRFNLNSLIERHASSTLRSHSAFKTVPAARKADTAKATFSLVDGERDPNGAALLNCTMGGCQTRKTSRGRTFSSRPARAAGGSARAASAETNQHLFVVCEHTRPQVQRPLCRRVNERL